MSGYDIKKIVDVGLSHFWNENYGQIYPTLDALVKDGLASKTVDTQSGKRKRNLYSITPRGDALLQEWIVLPAAPPSVRSEMQLKFFLSGEMPSQISLKIVDDYKKQQKEILNEYKSSEIQLRNSIETGEYIPDVQDIFDGHEKPLNSHEKRKLAKVFLLTLRHGILSLEGRLLWCDEVREQLVE